MYKRQTLVRRVRKAFRASLVSTEPTVQLVHRVRKVTLVRRVRKAFRASLVSTVPTVQPVRRVRKATKVRRVRRVMLVRKGQPVLSFRSTTCLMSTPRILLIVRC